MLSSTPNALLSAEQLTRLKELLATDQIRVLAKQGGGNSKVFCVAAKDKKWAVKSYPPYAPGQRDRLAAEVAAYQFLNQQHVPAVPRLKTCCTEERWLIIDWVEGDIPNSYTDHDVGQAISFIHSIAQLNELPISQTLPLAAEACLSLEILIEQLHRRLQRLEGVAVGEPMLACFLQQAFLPALMKYEERAREQYRHAGINVAQELDFAKRSLIPADFGFHNALRDESGELTFFDFDYFGWDDPVKLLADILWHPKMRLSKKQQQLFVEGFAKIYADDADFLHRFHSTYPLFGLRWTLILLNEFIPAFWQNRQHAEAHHDQQQAKQEQLRRAQELLKMVEHHELTTATSI